MSNMSDPAEFIAGISTLPVEQQVRAAKAHVRTLSVNDAFEFINDPAVKSWIDANVKAINADSAIPKSHGGPGR